MRSTPARERILSAAAELFDERGVRAVGMETVVAASGVAKTTLYAHFPTKDALVLAYLAGCDERWRRALREAAEAASDEPAGQLVGLFDAVVETCSRSAFRGCPFINAAAQSAPGSEVHEAAVAHKQAVRAWVTGLARATGVADPYGLARALTVLIDGALAGSPLDPGPEVALAARATARALVPAALVPAPAPASGDDHGLRNVAGDQLALPRP